MKKHLYAAITAVFLLALWAPQTKAQNIVEYFGKEKITATSEGTIIHTFRDGYLLPVFPSVGTLFNGQDMVGWMYATGNFKAPSEGTKIDWEYPTKPSNDIEQFFRRARGGNAAEPPKPLWTWSGITADDTTDVFQARDMRWSYLYTQYDSPREQVVLLDATGGTRTFINGMPHEGDHYDFGYSLVPVKLRKGTNEIVYTPGRFGRVSAKIVVPFKPVMFTPRDLTLPDVITGETDEKWGAIRVVNATEKEIKGLSIETILPTGESAKYSTDDIIPLSVRKVKFLVPAAKSSTEGKLVTTLVLRDSKGKEIDRMEIELQQRPATKHHERTFVSKIDGSVQYYSVAPSTTAGPGQAFILSVHGASVEARNQSRAYSQKDWTYIVAPTNRRPFGFNWEEWGRIDALEVLEHAKKLFKTDPQKTYLTGHSMGGHGTWIIGTTYPDKFAAIAPCASYPDIAGYGRGRGDNIHRENPHFDRIERAANAGRTVSLVRNLLQSGVYIYHGDADEVVSIEQVRPMRELLGTFHPNFCYYEYPGAPHWFGYSVDWEPIFEFFKRQSIPLNKEVSELDFHTATPVISASDHWLRVEQQEAPYAFTNIKAAVSGDTVRVTAAENVTFFTIDLPSMGLGANAVVNIGGNDFTIAADKPVHLKSAGGSWAVSEMLPATEKYSLRGGGFKQAFDNNVVFVYATGGTKAENDWYLNRARFDAETFYYRGNGSIDVVADRDFRASDYPDRNVVIYGNATCNRAWEQLLGHAPFKVSNGRVMWGVDEITGDDIAMYCIYPRSDSRTACVGIVAGTGERGMRATYANNYISGITGFPDYMIFRSDLLRDGLSGMETTGFFDNNWQISNW